MTANPLAPLRYRPGKPIGDGQPSSSESESESDSETEQSKKKTAAAPKATSFPKISTSFDPKARQAAIAAQRAKEAQAQKAEEEGFVTASESSGDEATGSGEGSDDEEDEESDYESSEDETRTARFVAPTFISKAQRKANNAVEKPSADVAAEREEARRKEKADEMLKAQLEKDAAERIAARRAWDDDDEAIADEVDDTDDIDPDAERAAWKLRELRRIKRDREAIEEAEKEHEEIERRRNLSKEDREAEDAEYIAAQNAEKEGKGTMGFMQKYFHKGAFFQGEEGEAEEAAKRRDIMGARYVDDAVNRELLPSYMQIRDMTKLGKKGRTKYKDLKSEDTGRWGDDRKGGGYRGEGEDRQGPSGANASAVGARRPRDDGGGERRDEKRPRYD